jgi:hypothetical protein
LDGSGHGPQLQMLFHHHYHQQYAIIIPTGTAIQRLVQTGKNNQPYYQFCLSYPTTNAYTLTQPNLNLILNLAQLELECLHKGWDHPIHPMKLCVVVVVEP